MKKYIPREEWAILAHHLDQVSLLQKDERKQSLRASKAGYHQQLDRLVALKNQKNSIDKKHQQRHFQQMLEGMHRQDHLLHLHQKEQADQRVRLQRLRLQQIQQQDRKKEEAKLQKMKPDDVRVIEGQYKPVKEPRLDQFYQYQIRLKKQKQLYQKEVDLYQRNQAQSLLDKREQQRQLALQHIAKGFGQDQRVFDHYQQLNVKSQLMRQEEQRQQERYKKEKEAGLNEEQRKRRQKVQLEKQKYRQQILAQIQKHRVVKEREEAEKIRFRPPEIIVSVSRKHNPQYLDYLKVQQEFKRNKAISERYMTDDQVRINRPLLQHLVKQAPCQGSSPFYLGVSVASAAGGTKVKTLPSEMEHVKDRLQGAKK